MIGPLREKIEQLTCACCDFHHEKLQKTGNNPIYDFYCKNHK